MIAVPAGSSSSTPSRATSANTRLRTAGSASATAAPKLPARWRSARYGSRLIGLGVVDVVPHGAQELAQHGFLVVQSSARPATVSGSMVTVQAAGRFCAMLGPQPGHQIGRQLAAPQFARQRRAAGNRPMDQQVRAKRIAQQFRDSLIQNLVELLAGGRFADGHALVLIAHRIGRQ